MKGPLSLARIAALLLLLATAVFAIGIVSERAAGGEASESHPTDQAATTSEVGAGETAAGRGDGHDEGAEASEANPESAQHEEASAGAARPGADLNAAAQPRGASSETMLGLNPESNGMVAAAIVISSLLAAALWFRETPAMLGVVVIVALLFALLDLREIPHQLAEARGWLVAVALLAAALHFTVAVVAGLPLARRVSPGSAAPG